jgi:hypothetical protein
MKLMAQFVWIAFFITVCCAGIAPDTESPVVFWVLFCIVAWIPVVMWIGCAFTLFCLLFQPSSRYLFDRDEGRMKFFHQSRTLETRLLTDILAIQIIMCESGYNVMGERYERYQLNLVCNEPYEPRLNPIDTYELALVRQSGEKLAEFLEVPLLDQTQREEPIAR